ENCHLESNFLNSCGFSSIRLAKYHNHHNKLISALIFLLLCSAFLYAQQPAKANTIVPGKGSTQQQLKDIKQEKIKTLSDSTGNQPKKNDAVDTTIQNKYGDLLNDDTAYNRKYPLWKPVVQVAAAN